MILVGLFQLRIFLNPRVISTPASSSTKDLANRTMPFLWIYRGFLRDIRICMACSGSYTKQLEWQSCCWALCLLSLIGDVSLKTPSSSGVNKPWTRTHLNFIWNLQYFPIIKHLKEISSVSQCIYKDYAVYITALEKVFNGHLFFFIPSNEYLARKAPAPFQMLLVLGWPARKYFTSSSP